MSVYMLVDVRSAGKAAYKAGQPRDANPYPNCVSWDDEWQMRKHEAWERGWEYAEDQADWLSQNG